MSFSMWLWKWIGSRPVGAADCGTFDHAATLSVRKLEDRRVLSVSAGFSGGALDVAIDTTFTNPQHIDATDNVAITVDTVTHRVLVNTKPIDLGGGSFLLASNVTSINVHDATSTNNTIDLSGVAAATGFTHAGGLTVQLSGGSGNDTITGSAFSDLIAVGSGNNTIDGGGSDDTFQFSTGFHTNTVTNVSGTNSTLDLSSVTSSLTANLQAHTITDGTGSISFSASDIDTIVGGTNVNNTFKGLNATSVWTIGTTGNTYASGTVALSFSHFSTLQGGSGNDTFDFDADSTLTVHSGAGTNNFNLANGISAGTLVGDSGTNTLSYAAYSTSVTVNLLTSTATNVASISGFDNVTGGTNNDSLIGDNSANTLNGGGGLDTLTGNDGNDTLINGCNSVGGNGNDIIQITSNLLMNNGSPITLNAESIFLNANLSTIGSASAGSVNLTGAVTLGANVTITTNNTSPSTDGDVTFSSTINSDGTARSLVVNSGSGDLSVAGVVGGTAPLASLQITSANQVDFHGDVTASGSVAQLSGTSHTTFDGGVTSQNGSVSITTSGAISVGNDVDAPGTGAGGITLNSTGNTVTVTGSLSTNLPNGISISSSGNATINGTMTASNGSISISSGSSVFVSGGISADDVTLIAAGTGSVTMSTSSTNDILALNVTIQSGSGGIGSSIQSLRINASTITATTTGNADVYVSDVGGGVAIAAGGLNAGTGTIHLGGGQVSLGGSNRIADTTTVTVASKAQLRLQGFNESIAALNLESGTTSGSTITTGLGTLTLLGNISLVSTGTGATGASISGNLSLGGANRTITVANGNAANDLTIGANITASVGGIGLTKSGAGTLLLSGSNSFTGTTAISAGTVAVSGGNAIANTSAVSIAASTTLALQSNETIGGLSGSGTVTNSSGGGAAVSLTVAGSGTFSGVMSDGSGQFSLVINGTGTTLILTAANTYSGATTITSGTLQIDGSVTSNVNVGVSGTLSGSGIITGGVSNLGTFRPGLMSISGDLTSSGAIQFTVNSGWTIPGTDYSQILVGGNLNLSSSTISIVNTIDASAPLLNQFLTLISHAGTANKTTTNGSTAPADGATVTAGTHSFKLFFNGADGNDVVLVEASLPSIAYVSNTSWAGLTGGMTILDADLGTALNQPAILGVNAFTTVSAALASSTASSQVIVNAGTYHEAVNVLATHTLTMTTGAAVTLDSLAAGSGTFVQILGTSLTVGNAANTTVAAVISGTGNLIKSGTGTLTLSGVNLYSGTTSISAGTLQLNGSITSDVSVGVSGTLSGSGTVTGNVSNLGTFRPGLMTISGDLTSTGSIQFTVNSGWTIVGTDYSQVVVGGNVDLSNSTLSLLNTKDTSAPLVSQLLKLINHAGNVNATITNGSTLPLEGATLAVGTHSFKLFFNGGDGNDVVLVEASPPNIVYVSNTAWTGLTRGTTIPDADLGTPFNQPAIFGVNAFTSITAALASSSANGQIIMNAGTYSEAVSLLGARTLTITGGAAITLNSLSAVAGTFVQILGTSLTVGDGTNTTLASVITGTGNLTKVGTGTLTLSGISPYSGLTTINAGTLQLGGSIGGSVDVGVSGTLSGSGAIAGDVSNLGTFLPGLMTISGNLTSSGSIHFTVNSGWTIAGTDYSQISVGGNLDLSHSTLSIVNTKDTSAPLVNQLLKLISHAGSANQTITNGGTLPLNGATLTVGTHSFKLFFNGGDGNDVVLIEASTPNIVYVSNTAWTTLSPGAAISDADFGTLLNQPAIFGVNAFASVSTALASSTTNSQVIVNAGTYHEAVSVLGTQTLAVTGNAAVFIDSLSGIAGTFIQNRGISLTIGDATDTTVASVISGTGQLIKVGAGTLTLSGNNTYSGTTSVNAGMVALANSNALGATTAGTTIANGAALDLNGQSVGAESLSISGSGIAGSGVIINSDVVHAASVSGNVTLASDTTLGGPGNLTFVGTVNGTAANAQSLNLIGSSAKRFTNVIGGTNALSNLTQGDASGSLELDQNVTVNSATLNANVILDGMTFKSSGAIVIGNAASDALSVTGNATSIQTTGGSIVLNATTSAHQNLTVTAAGPTSDLEVNSSLIGDSDVVLALNAGRTVAINSDIATTGTGSITVSGNSGAGARNIILNGAVNVSVANGDVTLDADQGLSSSGNFSGISIGAGTIRATGSGNINLAGRAGSDVTTGSHIGVSVGVGGQVTSVSGNISIVGIGGVGLATDDGVSIAGSVSATGSGAVVVTGTGGGSDGFGIVALAGGAVSANNQQITLTSDSMSLDGSVNAGSANVTLVQRTNGTVIDLGGADVITGGPAKLGLSEPELNHITASRINIGNSNSGAITVSSDIHLGSPSPVSTLVLTTGSTVTATTGGVVVNNLAIIADSAVTFASGTTNVANVGIQTANGDIRFVTSGSLNVTNVAGVSGLDTSASSGNITLSAGGSIGLLQAVNAGSGTARISSTTGGVNQAVNGVVTASILGVTNAGAGDVLMTAANHVNVFGATNSAPGGAIKFADIHGLTIGPVLGDGLAFMGTSGIATSNGDVTLHADGTVTIDGDINAGTGTVRIQTTSGDLTQNPGDTVTAAMLGINNSGAGMVRLTDANQIGTVAILNGLGGDVVVHNAAPLSIGSVSADGSMFVAVNGIVAGDSTHPDGNIMVTSDGNLMVLNPIQTFRGNINLQAFGIASDVGIQADVTTSGGNGNVTIDAGHVLRIFDAGLPPEIKVGGTGIITLTAQSQVIIDANVVIQSGTGAIAGTPPLIANIQTPPLSALGEATASFDYGRPGEHNFRVSVDWGDGTVQTFQFADPGHLSLKHLFGSNPNKTNPSAPIDIKFQIVQDPNVKVFSNGVNQDTSIKISSSSIPGTGLAAYVANLAPPVAYLTIPEAQKIVDRLQLSGTTLNEVTNLRVEAIRSDELAATERQVAVEILSPEGQVQQRITLPESVLDDSLEFIRKLPDGKYRFQLQEPGEVRQRLLLEFEVRQGKIVSSNDEGYRPPSSTKGKAAVAPVTNDVPPPAAPQQELEKTDSTQLDRIPDALILSDELLAYEIRQRSENHDRNGPPVARWDGWSSLAAQRAWKRAERVVDRMEDASGDSSSEPPSLEDSASGESDSSSNGDEFEVPQTSVMLVGAAGAAVFGAKRTKAHPESQNAGPHLSRAARLFRRYTNASK